MDDKERIKLLIQTAKNRLARIKELEKELKEVKSTLTKERSEFITEIKDLKKRLPR